MKRPREYRKLLEPLRGNERKENPRHGVNTHEFMMAQVTGRPRRQTDSAGVRESIAIADAYDIDYLGSDDLQEGTWFGGAFQELDTLPATRN